MFNSRNTIRLDALIDEYKALEKSSNGNRILDIF